MKKKKGKSKSCDKRKQGSGISQRTHMTYDELKRKGMKLSGIESENFVSQ